jgi:hypothetical protein
VNSEKGLFKCWHRIFLDKASESAGSLGAADVNQQWKEGMNLAGRRKSPFNSSCLLSIEI